MARPMQSECQMNEQDEIWLISYQTCKLPANFIGQTNAKSDPKIIQIPLAQKTKTP